MCHQIYVYEKIVINFYLDFLFCDSSLGADGGVHECECHPDG